MVPSPSILPLLGNTCFDPEAVETLSAAFDDAWAKIITYALLYMTLVLRPQGFFGQEIEA